MWEEDKFASSVACEQSFDQLEPDLTHRSWSCTKEHLQNETTRRASFAPLAHPSVGKSNWAQNWSLSVAVLAVPSRARGKITQPNPFAGLIAVSFSS